MFSDYKISKNRIKQKLLDDRLDIVYLIFELYLDEVCSSREIDNSHIDNITKRLCGYLCDLNYVTISGKDRYIDSRTINRYLKNWLIVNYYDIGFVYCMCVLDYTDKDRLSLVHEMEDFTITYMNRICNHINQFKCFNKNLFYKNTIDYVEKYREEN